MYELKCPSCEHVITASFVRIGAAVRCPSCAQAYRVAEPQVTRRVVAVAPGTGDDPSDPLLPQADNVASASRSGLSDGTDDEPVQGEPVQAEPVTSDAPPEAAGLTVNPRLWLFVGGGFIGALLALLLIFSLLGGSGEATQPGTGEPGGEVDTTIEAGPRSGTIESPARRGDDSRFGASDSEGVSFLVP